MFWPHYPSFKSAIRLCILLAWDPGTFLSFLWKDSFSHFGQGFLFSSFGFQFNSDLIKEAFSDHTKQVFQRSVLFLNSAYLLWSSFHFLLLTVILFIFCLANFPPGSSLLPGVEDPWIQTLMSAYCSILHLHILIEERKGASLDSVPKRLTQVPLYYSMNHDIANSIQLPWLSGQTKLHV